MTTRRSQVKLLQQRLAETQAELAEKEAEHQRTLEELSAERRSSGSEPETPVAGRPAVQQLKDELMVQITAAINAFPHICETKGFAAALDHAAIELPRLIHAMALADYRTPDLVQSEHRIFSCLLDEASVGVLIRRDRAGARCRRDTLNAILHYIYKPAVRATFEKSQTEPTFSSER